VVASSFLNCDIGNERIGTLIVSGPVIDTSDQHSRGVTCDVLRRWIDPGTSIEVEDLLRP